MYDYVDPTDRARFAIWAVLVNLGGSFFYSITNAYTMGTLDPASVLAIGELSADQADTLASVVALFSSVLFFAAVVFAARWIWRVNANAHSFSDALTISPGWNVGWFFIPIANFWMPFRGLSETWRATVNPADLRAVGVPAFMFAWWGMWLLGDAMSYVSLYMWTRADTQEAFNGLMWMDFSLFAVQLLSSLLFIHLIRKLTAAQREAIDHRAFT